MVEVTTAEQVVRELFEAIDAGRLDELLQAIHPGAELNPLAADGETLLGREGAAQWLDGLQSRDTLLRHSVERTIPLPGDAIVAVGRQQRFEPSAGLMDRPVVWLLHLRDGRLWRGCVCASVEDAIAQAGDGASSDRSSS